MQTSLVLTLAHQHNADKVTGGTPTTPSVSTDSHHLLELCTEVTMLICRRRLHQRLLQLGAVWAACRPTPLVHSTRWLSPLLSITHTRSSAGFGHALVSAMLL